MTEKTVEPPPAGREDMEVSFDTELNNGGDLSDQPVTCDNCGVCCRHMVQPPFIGPEDDEFVALPLQLRDELSSFNKFVRPSLPEDYPCVWLDLLTMRCRHYEHRPSICRDFDVGGESCIQMRVAVGFDV